MAAYEAENSAENSADLDQIPSEISSNYHPDKNIAVLIMLSVTKHLKNIDNK